MIFNLLLINVGILGGQGSTARLDFWPPLGTDASLIDCSWSRNGNLISIDGNKYVRLGPRSLQISDIVGADEGTYSCNYNYLQRQNSNDVTVIYVIGEYSLISCYARFVIIIIANSA